jgi:hypothetical protein
MSFDISIVVVVVVVAGDGLAPPQMDVMKEM